MVYIKEISYSTERDGKIDIEFNANVRSKKENIYSVIVGNNGIGKTAILEAIIGVFSNRYQSASSNFVNESLLKLSDGQKFSFMDKSKIGNQSTSEEKSELKKIIVSTYTPYDRLISNKSNRRSIGLDKNRVEINFPENTVFNIRSLASTSYLKNKLDVTNIAIKELARIIGFEHDNILLHIQKMPQTDKSILNKRFIELEYFEKARYNKLISKRFEIVDSDKKNDKRNSKTLQDNEDDILEKIRRSNESSGIKKSQERSYKTLIDIKKLLIRGKRAHYSSDYRTQYLTVEKLIQSYCEWYEIGEDKGEELIRIDIELLELLDIYMVNNLVLTKQSGSLTLDNLSSGEFSLFTRIMEISSSIDEHSIILIDEPETHLNPKWIYEYMFLLHKLYEGKACHFIIISQSPFIVGSAKKEDIIVLKKDLSAEENVERSYIENETLGGMFNQLLQDVFDIFPEENKVAGEYMETVKKKFEQDAVSALELAADLAESPQKNSLINTLLSIENLEIVEKQIDKLEEK